MRSRRIFLQQLGIATSGFLIPQKIYAYKELQSETALFIDESGEGRTTNVIGVLRSSATTKNETIIKALRKKNKYTRELKYRSTDKFKVSFAQDLIDHFFEDPSLSFYGRFISKKDINPGDIGEDTIVNINIKKIVLDATKGAKSLLLITTDRRGYSASTFDENYFKNKLHVPCSLKYESDNYELSQLADLFTGSLNAGDTISTGNSIKSELRNYLEKKLKVKNLSEIYNKPGEQKFIVKKN